MVDVLIGESSTIAKTNDSDYQANKQMQKYTFKIFIPITKTMTNVVTRSNPVLALSTVANECFGFLNFGAALTLLAHYSQKTAGGVKSNLPITIILQNH